VVPAFAGSHIVLEAPLQIADLNSKKGAGICAQGYQSAIEQTVRWLPIS